MIHILIPIKRLRTIKFLILICLGLFVAGDQVIAQQTSKSAKKRHSKRKKVKKKPAAPALPLFTLSGKIMMVEAYCGGAAATRELINEIKKPKPCREKYFFIKKGDANSAKNPVIDVIKVDSTGNFSITLKQGVYCIIQVFQTKPLQLENYQAVKNFEYKGDDCMRKYWADCYQTVDLKSNISDFNITVYKKCFGDGNPCLIYSGPMPP
jgi:hypothetical protein